MTITIGGALPGDFPAIRDLLAASGLPEAGLADHLATALVGREAERVVGSAALELYGPDALLRSVAVDAALRGRGLGERLTRAALDLARRNGARSVYLLTETAGSFFKRLGFRPVARADVPARVQGSVEFTSACPVSALVMMIALD